MKARVFPVWQCPVEPLAGVWWVDLFFLGCWPRVWSLEGVAKALIVSPLGARPYGAREQGSGLTWSVIWSIQGRDQAPLQELAKVQFVWGSCR